MKYAPFIVITLGKDAVEERSPGAKIKTKVEITERLTVAEDCTRDVEETRKYLEVVVQRDDIWMTFGYPLEDGNLVLDLQMISGLRRDRFIKEVDLPCILCPPRAPC